MLTLHLLLSILVAGATAAAVVAVAYLSIMTIRKFIRERRLKGVASDINLMKRQQAAGKVRVILNFLEPDGKEGVHAWDADKVDAEIENLEDDTVYVLK
jgi:hypothetical protein